MQDNFNIHGWRLNRLIEDKDPCWDGYQQIGMKDKDGKQVPNCVPVKEEKGQCPECGCEMEGKMCNECGYTMEEAATFTNKFDDNPKLKGDQKDLPDEVQAKIVAKEDTSGYSADYKKGYRDGYADGKEGKFGKQFAVKEGEDHEVSMAQNSLKSIISSASQLISKLGDDERNIPGWIQDHITNAENFIDQANQGFHELDNKHEED